MVSSQMDCHFIQTAACTKNLSVQDHEIGVIGQINAQVKTCNLLQKVTIMNIVITTLVVIKSDWNFTTNNITQLKNQKLYLKSTKCAIGIYILSFTDMTSTYKNYTVSSRCKGWFFSQKSVLDGFQQ